MLQLMRNRLITQRGLADILRSSELSKKNISYSHYVNEEVNVLHIVFE